MEIDQLPSLLLETSSLNFKSENLDFCDFNKITINPSISEYSLPNFRCSVGYGKQRIIICSIWKHLIIINLG